MSSELDKKLKEIQIKFIGEHDWIKVRDLMVLKMQECQTEEDFAFMIKALLGSCFTSANSIDEARKELGLKTLSKEERDKIAKFGKRKNERRKNEEDKNRGNNRGTKRQDFSHKD